MKKEAGCSKRLLGSKRGRERKREFFAALSFKQNLGEIGGINRRVLRLVWDLHGCHEVLATSAGSTLGRLKG